MRFLEPCGRPEDANILSSCEEISIRSKELTPNVRDDIEKLIYWVRIYHNRLIEIEVSIRALIMKVSR